MLTPGKKVKIIGSFIQNGETEEYLMIDSFEKGESDATDKYLNSNKTVISCDCHKGSIEKAEFIKFEGEFEVLRSNEVFSKLLINDHVISIPNSKLVEVDEDA